MPAAEQPREFGPHPLTIIAEAFEAARLEGIPIRIGSHGVEWASWREGCGRWIREAEADGVDPIGAAILLKQPQLDDIDQAAAAAVNAPIPWVAGCIDGMERRMPSSAWRASIKAQLYGAGYSAGSWLRVQLHQKVGRLAGGGKV